MEFVLSSQRQKHQRCSISVLRYSPPQSYLLHLAFTLGQAAEAEEQKRRKELLLLRLSFSLEHFSGHRGEGCTKGSPGRLGCGGTGTGGILHQGKCHAAGSSGANKSGSCKRHGESGNRRGPGQEKEVGARSVSLAFCL